LNRRKQTGFTLIEILIVAALIALLSGIAAINIQRAFVDNQRKATFGEARSIATALSFVFEDTGVYPKPCFIQHNIYFIAPPAGTNQTVPGTYLVSGFEYMGYDVNQPATMTSRIIKNWTKGLGSPGYMAAGEGRRGLFNRRAGIVRMEIPTDIYNPVILPTGVPLPIYDWPADSWGRPYVVYMMYQEGMLPSGLPNVKFVDRPQRAPNFALCVVSYGPNGIPGGTQDVTQTDVALGQQLWLFSKVDRQYGPPNGDSDYRALRPTEYTPERRDAYSYVRLLGQNPPSYTGVIDPGSDDIVIDFY
jgi:prepilin-type N-terminal cleavage/methylation domain-containing protein